MTSIRAKEGPIIRSYSAIVRHEGNRGLLRALELSVLASRSGQPLHLHAQGVRGTGKTTTLRSAREILPPIRRIRGCPYQCHPSWPHCPQHRALDGDSLSELGTETVPMPFLEISHSATVGTVVGSIDLQRLTDPSSPEAALLPGTLARAHRGIVLVDEVNRLVDTAPALTDVLLDVMGTKPGRLQIEETGLERVTMPVSVTVWATSNPDEDPGPLEEIRRQLADRFDLAINVRRPRRRADVEAILNGSPDREGGVASGGGDVAAVRQRLARQSDVPRPHMPARLRRTLASAYVQFDLESLRAVEAIQLAAVAAAQADAAKRVRGGHITEVAAWALNHRVDVDQLTDVTEFLREACGEAEEGQAETPAGSAASGGQAALPSVIGTADADFMDGAAGKDHSPSRWARSLKAWLDRAPFGRLTGAIPSGGEGAATGGSQQRQGYAPPPPDRAERLRRLPAERFIGPAVHPDDSNRCGAPDA